MFHLIGAFVVLGVFSHMGWWVLTAVLCPLFVIWMLVDALLRTDSEYPGAGQNDKIVWVLLMLFIHPVALVYFFVVFRKIRRGGAAVQAHRSQSA